jgi:hypothetical protein
MLRCSLSILETVVHLGFRLRGVAAIQSTIFLRVNEFNPIAVTASITEFIISAL